MEFRILGPVEVWDGAQRLGLGGPKPRTLLAVLLLHANQVVSVDCLIDELWGEAPPPTARNQIQVYVSRLRHALQSGCEPGAAHELLATRPPGYMLQVDPEQADVHRFEALGARARQAIAEGADERGARLLRQALALWRGPALADAGSQALQRDEVPRLEELRLGALEACINAELRLGRHGELVAELSGIVAAHPLRERFWAQLMLALYRSGRQAEALAVYARARGRLVEELGIEPGAELQGLQRQILAADPTLEVPPEVAVAEPAGTGSHAGPVPRQLPADVASFTGREQELARLNQALAAAGMSRPVVISAIDGTGGIGKSALAIHAAHRLAERFPDGQLYVNLHGATAGLTPLASLDALGRMLRSLGVDPAQVPAQVEEAAGLFRSVAAGRRLLLVLDNAAAVEQVRPLLPASPTCGVLVTSRRVLATLEGARILHLDLLPYQQAVDLLGRIAGRQRISAEPKASGEVVRLCGYLPLAIQIAGARLAARPTWPVAELAERLADAAGRLEELATGDLAVRASFEISLLGLQHSPDHLDQAAAAAFGLLGLPDGPDLGVAAAARLLGQPEGTVKLLLERLVDAQLLQPPRPGRYQFHDLVRLYARHQAASTRPERERLAALERLFGFYAATAWHTLGLLRPGDQRLTTADPRWTSGGLQLPDAEAALRWLETERANLLAAIDQTAAITPAIPAKLATELTRALYGFFEVHNHWADGMRANQTALALARRTADQSGQAHAHGDLGVVHWWLERYPEALDHLQHALTLSRQLGDRRGQATSLVNLGTVNWSSGHHQEAVEHYQQALSLKRELGDRRGQAATLTNLGVVYGEFGRYQQAIDHHQQALTIYQQLGNRHGQAYCLDNLGHVYGQSGRYQQAIDHLHQALTLCGELGDRWGQAASLSNLGVVHERLGRYQQAIDHLQQALTLCRQLGDRRGQAEALRDLGDALLGAGHRQQARQAWQEAVKFCEALQIPEADEVRSRLQTLPAEPDRPPPEGQPSAAVPSVNDPAGHP